MDGHEAQEEDAQESECPVCYECLSGTDRTLSCGHVFCHDCLVKTLVSVNMNDGKITRDNIICPICRHLTFIKKQNEVVVSLDTGKDSEERGQTLEVPLPPPPSNLPPHHSARRASRSPNELSWFLRCFRVISERLSRHRLISPSHNASQIFIISAEGRPMAEEDVISVVTMAAVQPNRRQQRSFCTTARCLLFLLAMFTLLALIAATLPWIILV